MRGVARFSSKRPSSVSSSSSFSTFSGGGSGGRGRGRGLGTPPPAAPGRPSSPADAESEDHRLPPSAASRGRGHGHFEPFPASPFPLSSWLSNAPPPSGRGRSAPPGPPPPSASLPKQPVFFRRDADSELPEPLPRSVSDDKSHRASIHKGIAGALLGSGRGKVVKPSDPGATAAQENRHLRPRRAPPEAAEPSARPAPKLSREEAVKKAVGILSRGGGDGEGRGSGRSGRGRGGRGAQAGRGGRGGRGGDRYGFVRESDEDFATGAFLGNDADGQRLAERLGPEKMEELRDAFDNMCEHTLPSAMSEAYLDALDTNCLIEFEPEYLMEEFGTNPDIDDTPPIPLRDALEKMKPFLMQYEGIQSQEEWEEVMKETMETVPLLKEIVDQYSGPDRVTAMQQTKELERVAKTLPENIPSSVKRFTDRAVLSLKSNPGWGFDKKCQFMDKLAWEISQQYN